MRKHFIWLIIAAILLVTVSAGTTVALLTSSSNPVINTFTIGGVDITLTESTGQQYVMIPGVAIAKDPTVTVLANSETSWLFIKMEKTNDFDTFCTYAIQDGWLALEGQTDVYYQMVGKSPADQAFPVLKDNSVFVNDALTEEQLNAIVDRPSLSVTAYAVQSDGIATAADAWQALMERKEE